MRIAGIGEQRAIRTVTAAGDGEQRAICTMIADGVGEERSISTATTAGVGVLISPIWIPSMETMLSQAS